jgi:hypothetical protein
MSLGTALLVLMLASPPVKADAASAIEEEIKLLEITLAGYLSKGEIDAYAPYLAEDYVRISADGRVASKAEVLAEFRAASGPRSPLEPSRLTVRSYGDAAILNGELTIGSRRSRFTKVFIRRDGRWVMVNNQGTPLTPR